MKGDPGQVTHPSGQVGFSTLKVTSDPPVIPQLAKFLFGVDAGIMFDSWVPNPPVWVQIPPNAYLWSTVEVCQILGL